MPQSALAAPTSSNPLRLRRRRDLEVCCHLVRGRRHYVIKDPVAFRFHQLNSQEHFLWSMLDGDCTSEDVCRRFEQRFQPRRLSPLELEGFVAQLHRDGLVVADAPGQGEVLLARGRKSHRSELANQASNPLAIRFPGFDPVTILRWLAPLSQVLCSRVFVGLGSIMVLVALLAATLHVREFQLRLLELKPEMLVGLSAAIAALVTLKVLHEFAHALACQHFGRQCHEIGAMLLVFAPCLYCNVTDSWMLTSKWQRAAITAAGVWVELVLAAIFGFLWWFSEPGWFHLFAANVMVIGSINSLLLNGNPLLHFDGYYVLSDLAELPNLAQRSKRVLHGALRHWLLGIEPTHTERESEARVLLLYGAASTTYRIVLISLLVAGCYLVLKEYRLQAMVLVILVPLLVTPLQRCLMSIQQLMTDPIARSQMRPRRFLTTFVALLAMAGLAWVPLPRSVLGVATLRFADEGAVRVLVEGRLVEAAGVGVDLEAGDQIAQLENDQLAQQLSELVESEIQLKLQIKELQVLRGTDSDAATRIPTLREQLRGVERELVSRRADIARLRLVAPRSGHVAPPPELPLVADGELHDWTGTPLEQQNRGCFLAQDTLLCTIGDPERMSVIADVAPSAIDAVTINQSVRIQFPSLRGVLKGRVAEVARLDPQSHPELARLQGEEAEAAEAAESEARYAVRIELVDPRVSAPVGCIGWARISVEPMSVARRLSRWVGQTFRWRM